MAFSVLHDKCVDILLSCGVFIHNKIQSIDFVITRWILVHSLWLLSSMQGPVFVGCCYWFLGESGKEWNFPPQSKRHIPHPFFLMQCFCRTIVINPAWQFSVSLPPSFVSHKKSVLLLVLAHLLSYSSAIADLFRLMSAWCIARSWMIPGHSMGTPCIRECLHKTTLPMEHYGNELNLILSSPVWYSAL